MHVIQRSQKKILIRIIRMFPNPTYGLFQITHHIKIWKYLQFYRSKWKHCISRKNPVYHKPKMRRLSAPIIRLKRGWSPELGYLKTKKTVTLLIFVISFHVLLLYCFLYIYKIFVIFVSLQFHDKNYKIVSFSFRIL